MMLHNHKGSPMSRNLFPLSLIATLLAGTTMAEVPKVVADIEPVHSLVARVMEGVGTPALIVQPGASPHEYSLRPSEASALQEADLVFWVGEDLEPWMKGAIETLAGDAKVTELLDVPGTILLGFREGPLFEKHVHGAGEHHDDDDDEHAGEEDHDEVEHHHHGEHNPHAWLSPANAATWVNVIAAELSAADPDHAGTYSANAAAAQVELDTVSAEVNAILDPVRGGRFIVFHDAYPYFENAFDFPASGSISLSDASDPSPARIAEVQARVRDEGIECVLSEPEFNPGLVATVMEGTKAKTAVLDPLGSDLVPGPNLYPQLLHNLATSLAGCF